MDENQKESFLLTVEPPKRQRDARTLMELFDEVTGLQPELWQGIIGYGSYHYRYASGREGDAPAAAFSPRRTSCVIYLGDGVKSHEALLDRLGTHERGVGCLYLKDLEQIDVEVLRQIVSASFTALNGQTWTERARDAHS